MRIHLSKQILSLQLTSMTEYGCLGQSVDKYVRASPAQQGEVLQLISDVCPRCRCGK